MISRFFTIEHEKSVLDVLELRAAQLTLNFLNSSCDEDIKSSVREHYLNKIDASLPLTTDQVLLDQVRIDLKSNQKMTHSQVELFLCFSSAQMIGWQSLILVISLEHRRLFEDPTRSLNAMNAFRLLLQNKEENEKLLEIAALEKSLPNPLQPLEQIVIKLTHYLKNLPAEHQKYQTYILQRLLPIRRILDDVLVEAIKNPRPKGVLHTEGQDDSKQLSDQPNTHGKPTQRGNFNTTNKLARTDDEEAAHTVIQEFTAKTDGTLNDLEFRSDNAPDSSFITLAPDKKAPASLRQSLTLSAIHAKTVASHIERNEKRLITATNQITRYDFKCLLAALRQRANEQPQVVFILYLMFVTGRRLEQLLQAKKVRGISSFSSTGDAYTINQNKDTFWLFRPNLPKHALTGNLKRLVDQQTSPVILPLPQAPIDSGLLSELPELSKEIRQKLDDFVNDINREYKTKLTMSRIADFLSNFLHHQGVDDVINALVSGNPSIQEAGTYYHQYDHATVLTAYEIFTKEFFAAGVQEDLKVFIQNHPNGGSQLIVKQQAVAALFAHLVSKIDSSQGIAEFHNAYTYYIVHLLNLATGHRPVRDPFDDLNHIDLLNKKIFISDKESRFTSSSARSLVLPEIAVQQITFYLEHLKRLQLLLHSINPLLADAVDMTLAGKNRLFFLIEENELGRYQMQPLAPRHIKKYLGALFDIPTNWHRHYLRTALANHNINGELIDSWMGHAKIGQEGYSSYSGLSMQGLQKIAETIDGLMKELEVKALAGWGQ